MKESTSMAPAQENQHKACIDKIAINQDTEAFKIIFDHYAPLIRAFSLAREPGAELVADELAQIVMIKVWEKCHTYNSSKASVSTWIYTLARNSRIDLLRKNGRYTSQIDPEQLWLEEDDSTDPFLIMQQKRSEITIAEAFQKLPADQQDVISKVYLEGKSHQESADELNIPLGTIKSRVRLAMKKLQLLVRREV